MAALAHEQVRQISDRHLFGPGFELHGDGLRFFPKEVTNQVNSRGFLDVGGGVLISCRPPVNVPDQDPAKRLSPREYEVLQYIANGYPRRTIVAEIGTRSATISTQTSDMLRKLELADASEAATYIPIDEPQLRELTKWSLVNEDQETHVLTPIQARRLAGAWENYQAYVDDIAELADDIQPQVVKIIADVVKHRPTRLRIHRDIVRKIDNSVLLGELEHTGYVEPGTLRKGGVSLSGLIAALLFQREETANLMRTPGNRRIIQTIIKEESGLMLDRVYNFLEQRVEV